MCVVDLKHSPVSVLVYLVESCVHRYEIMLSTRPEKSVGTDDIWDLATDALKGALERKGWDYKARFIHRLCNTIPAPTLALDSDAC